MTAHLLQLQRAAGNTAVGQLVQPTAPAVWELPAATFGFDQATASDRLTAQKALTVMASKFEALQDFLSPEDGARIASALDGIKIEIRSLQGGGGLTARDVGDLNVVSALARMSFEQLSELAVTNLKAAVAKFFADHGPDDVALEQFREELHFAFIESASEKRIKELGEAFEKLKGYQEAGGKVVSWAKKVMNFLEAPERFLKKLEHVNEFAEKVEKLGNGVKEVLEIADDIGRLSGFDGQMVGETQNMINQFWAGFDMMDKFMSHFGKYVPLLGTLWSSYYKPLTEAILNGLMPIARYTDKKKRDLGLLGMMFHPGDKPREPGAAPRIPKEYMDAFPGGQPIYNYMYAVVHDRRMAPTPEATKFFIERRGLFQAAAPDREKIEVEGGSHWYNPWTWGAEQTSPNVDRWVRHNRDSVWAQLYGAFPIDY